MACIMDIYSMNDFKNRLRNELSKCYETIFSEFLFHHLTPI